MEKVLYCFIMFLGCCHAFISCLLRFFRLISLDTFQRLTLLDCDVTDRGMFRKLCKTMFD